MTETYEEQAHEGGEEPRALRDPSLFVNRELSWLQFNDRVLQLAEDDTLPLLDWLQSTSFASHEMERRRILIRLAHRLEAKRTPFLRQGGQNCLNREAWLPNGVIDALLTS